MINNATDYGYFPAGAFGTTCAACGKHADGYCCDGHGKRLSFDAWAAGVDREICRIEGTIRNEVTAPYSEMYLQGLSVMAAVDAAYFKSAFSKALT
jgi:hypothetical protein